MVPQLVLAEAAYLVAKQLGTIAEASFLRELADASLELHRSNATTSSEWPS